MRYTQKRRAVEKLLNLAINVECINIYGEKIGEDAQFFTKSGKNWALTSYSYDVYDDGRHDTNNCYYIGKKPTEKEIGVATGSYWNFNQFIKVSKKHLDALKNIKYESLKTVKALHDWKEAMESKELKQKACRQKVKELQLDFDGQISTKEIKKRYPHLYTNFSRTRISWYKRVGNYHYQCKPEFFIYIKPVSDGIYNKKEFETKMNSVKTA